MYIRFSQDLSYSILKNNSTPPPAILFIDKELSEFGINDAFVYHEEKLRIKNIEKSNQNHWLDRWFLLYKKTPSIDRQRFLLKMYSYLPIYPFALDSQ